jgi:hypothetical protein
MTMELSGLINELRLLAQQDDALSVSREVNELKVKFDDALLELERREQVAALEAEVNGEQHETADFTSDKNAFYELYLTYRSLKKEQSEAKQAIETANLKAKRSLIERLNNVIASEENIGAAFTAYKEIHEAWKLIGEIAREHRDAIQQEYSKLLESFFYNMKIYRELKEHDLKRNYQLKEEVIQQLRGLKGLESVKDIESKLRALQNEWEGIGPVMNEQWEALKSSYWDEVRQLYERIHAFYDERRTSLAENIAKKRALIEESRMLLERSAENTNVKSWEAATSELLALQEKWKAIGFGPRKENEEVWQEFRGYCDQFFSKKREYFSVVQEQFNHVAEKKKALIARANALKDSTDWKTTADALVKLQKEWKGTGHAGQKLEQKLWTDFRAACNVFFTNRDAHFAAEDEALTNNLVAKNALIEELQAYALPEDKQQALSELRSFATRFNALGKVPMKEKDTVYKAYKSALDHHYQQLKLEGEEKERILFQARIDTLSASPDKTKAFSKEKAELRQQIEQLKKSILQYENNLGFFARSSGADALRKEVEQKIQHAQRSIDGLIRRLKMIPNE